jgi:hypothetical protein
VAQRGQELVSLDRALVVHTGRMRGWCLDANDSDHLRPALRDLFRAHRRARRIHLIWDGGASHTAAATTAFLQERYPHVRTRVTPAHASWLDQAELLFRAFGARYLGRGDRPSRAAFIAHLEASWHEYNDLFAHPFTWSWTRTKMDTWLARHRP